MKLSKTSSCFEIGLIISNPKGKKLPSVHVLDDFREIVWPERLSKSSTMLCQSEGQMLLDKIDDHGLEQMIHFPTREKKIIISIKNKQTNKKHFGLDSYLFTGSISGYSLSRQLSDHDIVSGFKKKIHSTYKKISEEGFISER